MIRKACLPGLIQRAGGQPGDVLAVVEASLAKRPKVSGGGAGQVYLAPDLARVFDTSEKIADKAGDRFVTVERLLLALALEPGGEIGGALKAAGVTPPRSMRRSTNPQGADCR